MFLDTAAPLFLLFFEYLILSSVKNGLTTSSVLSVEQSSTISSSQFSYVCANTDRIESAMYFAVFHEGIIIETNSFISHLQNST